MTSSPLLVTFEDIDPVVRYTPFSQGNPSQGWKTEFPSNEFIQAISSSMQGVGNSLHRTTRAGAGFEFEFYGASWLCIEVRALSSLRRFPIPLLARVNRYEHSTRSGTSVQLFGIAGNTTYSVSLDGAPAKAFTEQNGLLAELHGLPAALHKIHLTVDIPSPALIFDRAEFNAGIDRCV